LIYSLLHSSYQPADRAMDDSDAAKHRSGSSEHAKVDRDSGGKSAVADSSRRTCGELPLSEPDSHSHSNVLRLRFAARAIACVFES
jgi:hypothetical protein